MKQVTHLVQAGQRRHARAMLRRRRLSRRPIQFRSRKGSVGPTAGAIGRNHVNRSRPLLAAECGAEGVQRKWSATYGHRVLAELAQLIAQGWRVRGTLIHESDSPVAADEHSGAEAGDPELPSQAAVAVDRPDKWTFG